MGFFTKAVTTALAEFPAINAQIDGKELIYHDYADVCIAVSSPKGLMVPVGATETLSLAETRQKSRSWPSVLAMEN